MIGIRYTSRTGEKRWILLRNISDRDWIYRIRSDIHGWNEVNKFELIMQHERVAYRLAEYTDTEAGIVPSSRNWESLGSTEQKWKEVDSNERLISLYRDLLYSNTGSLRFVLMNLLSMPSPREGWIFHRFRTFFLSVLIRSRILYPLCVLFLSCFNLICVKYRE